MMTAWKDRLFLITTAIMPLENIMTTKAVKKVVKKKATVKKNVLTTKKVNTITLTLKQAQSLRLNALKNGKNFAFLTNKINAAI